MSQDKPFEATAQRLARAKREGDLPRSADLTAIASLVCGVSVAFVAVPLAARAAAAALASAARGMPAVAAWRILAAVSLAVAIAAACAAIGATYLQTRAFAFKFPSLALAKLNPMSGMKKMLSRDAALAGAKATVVSSALCAALVPSVRAMLGRADAGATGERLAALASATLATAVTCAVAVSLAFAVVDVIAERIKWKRRLRMSFDELKRDLRASEGDPLLKGKRRRAQRALARGSIARLNEAAVVVTNPTHVAIALQYDPPAIAVPRVLVRAIDEGAQEVRRRARALEIPIVENVALARVLLATATLGEAIPPATYGAVAAIVAALARTRALG